MKMSIVNLCNKKKKTSVSEIKINEIKIKLPIKVIFQSLSIIENIIN